MERVFPFGSPLNKVEQQDRSPKKVFILGAFAKAVHAKWMDAEGNVKIEALPVASEPFPLWDGENAEQILGDVHIPPELGKLMPLEKKKNCIDKISMDFEVLWPLGCKREDAWFCYVMPYPTLNPGKIGLIKANYTAVAESYNLPECSIPIFNPAEFRKQSRLKEILIELKQSQADTIVLLGDIPIKHFLSHFSEFKSLKDFEKGLDNFGRLIHYGKKQKIEIAGKLYNVIPLIDPEHYSTTGNTSQKDCHIYWMGKGTIIQMKISSEGKDPSYVTKKPVVCPICFCRKIVTFANEKPPFSEKTKRAIREGRLILKDKEIKSEDVKYFCTECGFEFYEIQD